MYLIPLATLGTLLTLDSSMLPKKNRVSRKDFPVQQAKGLRVFSTFFTAVFYHIKNHEGSERTSISNATGKTTQNTKVSVVVSKKTAKTAVARNLLRRRFYELFAPFLTKITSTSTVVFYPKKEAQKAPFSVLKTEVEKAIKQAKLL